ncbi:hypothetical protein FNV43_RR05907 [Rhamnella rubrinervis]|uniref:Uncharacterized protein n=1 Tax=Rhamnella rubrinervis TaxID=2594499 RepID=A0A8K0ML93_9ROSA|nr:hypothetical protein FNV43_RR05907 [Rhamnella rubrinervis]
MFEPKPEQRYDSSLEVVLFARASNKPRLVSSAFQASLLECGFFYGGFLIPPSSPAFRWELFLSDRPVSQSDLRVLPTRGSILETFSNALCYVGKSNILTTLYVVSLTMMLWRARGAMCGIEKAHHITASFKSRTPIDLSSGCPIQNLFYLQPLWLPSLFCLKTHCNLPCLPQTLSINQNFDRDSQTKAFPKRLDADTSATSTRFRRRGRYTSRGIGLFEGAVTKVGKTLLRREEVIATCCASESGIRSAWAERVTTLWASYPTTDMGKLKMKISKAELEATKKKKRDKQATAKGGAFSAMDKGEEHPTSTVVVEPSSLPIAISSGESPPLK